MHVITARGYPCPPEIEENVAVVIVRENITPYTEQQEDGDPIEGFQWTEIRFTPSEASLIRRTGALNGTAEGSSMPTAAMTRLYLRQRLADTDYIIAKIAEAEGQEAIDLRAQYAETIQQRRAWRQALNEL